MRVFGTLIVTDGGCTIFGVDGEMGGGEGVNVGKDEDEDEVEGEVSLGWLFPAINDSKLVKLLDSNAVWNSSRRLRVQFWLLVGPSKFFET